MAGQSEFRMASKKEVCYEDIGNFGYCKLKIGQGDPQFQRELSKFGQQRPPVSPIKMEITNYDFKLIRDPKEENDDRKRNKRSGCIY